MPLFILSILSLRFSIKICIFLRKHAFVLLSFFLFLKIKESRLYSWLSFSVLKTVIVSRKAAGRNVHPFCELI